MTLESEKGRITMDIRKPVNDPHRHRNLAKTVRLCCCAAMVVIAAVFVWSNLVISSHVPDTTQKTDSAVEHFVFLFRQNPSTKLSDADQKRRLEVRAWAIGQNS